VIAGDQWQKEMWRHSESQRCVLLILWLAVNVPIPEY
jgi:hypothetical protein